MYGAFLRNDKQGLVEQDWGEAIKGDVFMGVFYRLPN